MGQSPTELFTTSTVRKNGSIVELVVVSSGRATLVDGGVGGDGRQPH